MNAVVDERDKALLVDRVPETQLSGDPAVEPIEQREAVAAFRGRRQTEKLHGLDMLEQCFVRLGRGVVELIDDDNIEMVPPQMGQAGGVETLDGRKDVLKRLRALPAAALPSGSSGKAIMQLCSPTTEPE